MSRFVMLAALFGCDSPSPLPEPSVPTIVLPAAPTTVIAIPSDCRHLIVDIQSDEEADMVIGCFDETSRTYFTHQHGPSFATDPGSGDRRQLVIKFVDRDKLASPTR